MVQVNGNLEDICGYSIEAYIKEKGYRKDVIAVEVNEEIVSKDLYETVKFKDEDVVEIIQFVRGG